jgi:hypothetical protein
VEKRKCKDCYWYEVNHALPDQGWCFYNPPIPTAPQLVPSKLQGAPPMLSTGSVVPPVQAIGRCHNWSLGGGLPAFPATQRTDDEAALATSTPTKQ